LTRPVVYNCMLANEVRQYGRNSAPLAETRPVGPTRRHTVGIGRPQGPCSLVLWPQSGTPEMPGFLSF